MSGKTLKTSSKIFGIKRNFIWRVRNKTSNCRHRSKLSRAKKIILEKAILSSNNVEKNANQNNVFENAAPFCKVNGGNTKDKANLKLASADRENDSTVTTFENLGLCSELSLVCDSLGWTKPTLIQEKSLPYSLKKKDIIGLAETGSGKTAAFVLPILQHLLENPSHRGVFALVLAPTRELSLQISQQFQALGSTIELRVCTVFGGVDMVSQIVQLSKKPHVVIGTPGRLLDHLQNTKGFHLSTIQVLVLDEADRLLSMDFEEALNNILVCVPKGRQTLLFSATMTDRVSKLERASLNHPVRVSVSSKYDTVKNLTQSMKLIPLQFKLTYLCSLIQHFKHYSSMIFVNTCSDAQKIATCLRHLSFDAICLHGKMSQYQRLGALNAFKSGRKRTLVTTEVGSRGLDIAQVDIVINYDLPTNPKDYIHRVGRTARAGRCGRSISLVTPYDIEVFQQIEMATKKKMSPFIDLVDEQWRRFHETVEEMRLQTEKEAREEQANAKNLTRKKHGFKPNKKRHFKF